MQLRIIFGSKRYEVIGGWRKPHNEELHNLYSSPNIIRMIQSRRMRWAEYIARMHPNAYRVLVGKPEGKIPLGKTRCRWQYNDMMDLRECAWSGMDWIHLAQDMEQWRALMNAVMNFRVP
jgi:hypothetical protein